MTSIPIWILGYDANCPHTHHGGIMTGQPAQSVATPRPIHDERARPSTLDEQPTWLATYGDIALTAATAVLIALGWLLGRVDVVHGTQQTLFYAAAYVTGGSLAAIESVRALRDRRLEVDLLMVTAAIGAAIIGHWIEGGVLLFLFSLGGALEHYAMGRTHNAIRALMDLRPDDALVLRDGIEQRLPIDLVLRNDVVLVRPGERLPTDGVVIGGASAIDQAAITGESMPVSRTVGDSVFAGTINGHGALQIRVTSLANESMLAKIISIVADAQAERSGAQRFTDRFEGRYAGAVIGASALYALVQVAFGATPTDAFYQSMILLVVASPCALVISTPASTLSALANAARNGVLFKGSAHLEGMGTTRVVVFDKTGTLTQGRPRLTDLVPMHGYSETELLTLTASGEAQSEHPLATAILEAARAQQLPLRASAQLQAIPGRGLQVEVDGELLLIGNDKLLREHGHVLEAAVQDAADRLRDQGRTTMIVARALPTGVDVVGVIGVADAVRPAARDAIAKLKALGVEQTIMLTGDHERAARAIAHETGIDSFQSGLMPDEKLKIVKELVEQYGSVVMVGDGVNDAPALASASIGVAMGAAGTDVALETADVVLMSDDLSKLPYAIGLSRRARRVITQNLAFALTVIAVLVIGTLLDRTTLPMGVVGHEGSTILVVLNGLRLLGNGRS